MIGNVYLFPSERAGFTLLSSEIQKLDIPLPSPPAYASESAIESAPKKRLPLALENYMLLLHRTLLYGSAKQRRAVRTSSANSIQYDILDRLFREITGDKIFLSSSEPQLPRKIRISTGRKETDVLAASSGVKSLIGLSLYIQYLAQKNDLIVIDEPEQNLHPMQQAKFIEYIAILVNNGVRVALTTHSPYIIEHLENLILAYDCVDRVSIVSSLYLQNSSSLMNYRRHEAGGFLCRQLLKS